MAKRTKREGRIRSLVTNLEAMPENDVRKVPLAGGQVPVGGSVRFATPSVDRAYAGRAT